MSGKYEVQPRKLGSKNKLKSPSASPVTEYPPDLQKFVEKNLQRAQLVPPPDQQMVNYQMQSLLQMATLTNLVFLTNWKKQTLPYFDGGKLQLVAKSLPKPTTSKRTMVSDSDDTDDFESADRKRARQERFKSVTPVAPVVYATDGPVKGYSNALEKNYLRLTLAPDPANVRPQEVLEKSLEFVMNKYRDTNNYSYVIGQFKSIRQDLTVQHIKNMFTIRTYEENARISLDNGDLGEFNQCQTQLKVLYHQQRRRSGKKEFVGSEPEFIVYRIIYMMITANQTELAKIYMEVITTTRQYEATDDQRRVFDLSRTLFECQEYILTKNYTELFKQFTKLRAAADQCQVPLVGKTVWTLLAPKHQMRALAMVSVAYRKLSVEVIEQMFAITRQFYDDNGVSKYITGTDFDCAAARQPLRQIISSPKFSRVDIKGQK